MLTKNQKILMVVLPYIVETDSTGAKIRSYHAFPYGVLSIVNYNKDKAEFMILDLNKYDDPASYPIVFKYIVERFEPDIVGFSMMFDNSYQYLRRLLDITKDIDEGIITILGGAAASYSYEDILKEQPELDAICFGEGEIPLQDLLEEWEYTDKIETLNSHPSWVTRYNKKKMPQPLFVYDLDEVIDINYDYININDYRMKQAFSPFIDSQDKAQFFLMTSRGCPFQCTFCSNSKIHGKKVRYASVEKILEHVDKLVNEQGMEVLTIYDDQILLDTDRAKAIFRGLAKYKIRVELPNGVSVAFMDEELCFLMQEAGMDTIYLAIESGSEYVLKHLIRKPLKLEQVKPVVDMLREYNFFIHGFFVMGMPGEEDFHLMETMEFMKEIKLDWCGLNMATPVRGSALYDQCIANGWIQKQRIEDIVDKKYIIRMPGVNPAEVEEGIYRMNLRINFIENQRMAMGDYQTAIKCFEDVLQRYHNHAFAYYYIAKCKEKLFQNADEENRRFMNIINTDRTWMIRAIEMGVR